MSLLVVGSMALDSVKTPFGEVSEVLGGSAVYFSYAASFFGPVRLVSVVGDDFPESHIAALKTRNIDTDGLIRQAGRTFRWSGVYDASMNERETLSVELNVFGEFDPVLPKSFCDSRYVFLANGPPSVQNRILDQVVHPELAVADTMDHWIREERQAVVALMGRVGGAMMNDFEARLFTGEENLPRAGQKILQMGPRFVVIKKGEHGSLLIGQDGYFVLPAYPTTTVLDPTGAGDSFAGAMCGHLARTDKVNGTELKRALAYGTVVASLNVEDFSLNRLSSATVEEIEQRYRQLQDMTVF